MPCRLALCIAAAQQARQALGTPHGPYGTSRSYAHPGWRNLLFASRLPGVHVGGGPPVAEVVYGLLIVVGASAGAAVRAGRLGWSLRRTAAAPHTAGCDPRRAPPPASRGRVPPFHGVAGRPAAPQSLRPLRGPAMVSRSPAKRPCGPIRVLRYEAQATLADLTASAVGEARACRSSAKRPPGFPA
jgi:hypothetical protein